MTFINFRCFGFLIINPVNIFESYHFKTNKNRGLKLETIVEFFRSNVLIRLDIFLARTIFSGPLVFISRIKIASFLNLSRIVFNRGITPRRRIN